MCDRLLGSALIASGAIAPSVRKTAAPHASPPSMPSPLPPSLWSDARPAGCRRGRARRGRRDRLRHRLHRLRRFGQRGWRTGTDLGGHRSRAGAEQRRDRRLPRVRDPQHDQGRRRRPDRRRRIGRPGHLPDAGRRRIDRGRDHRRPPITWQLSLAAAPLDRRPDRYPDPAQRRRRGAAADDRGAHRALAAGHSTRPTARRRSRSATSPFPDGLETTTFDGTDPADVADQVESSGPRSPASRTLPTCSWSAPPMRGSRCRPPPGRPVPAIRSSLPTATTVPAGTMKVIKRHPNTPVFVLGPSSAISDEALKKLGSATRVGAEDPVENAIEFAQVHQRQLRLEHQRPRARVRDRDDRPAARRRRGRAAGQQRRQPGPAAAHRRSGHRAARPAELPQRYPAGLRGRPDPGRLQPRLDHRQQRGDLGALPGAGRPVDQARSGQRREGTSRRHPPGAAHHHAGDRSGVLDELGQSSTTNHAATPATAPPATAPAGSRSAVEVGWRR